MRSLWCNSRSEGNDSAFGRFGFGPATQHDSILIGKMRIGVVRIAVYMEGGRFAGVNATPQRPTRHQRNSTALQHYTTTPAHHHNSTALQRHTTTAHPSSENLSGGVRRAAPGGLLRQPYATHTDGMPCSLHLNMTIYSLAAHDEGLTPIEVEIISIPGPPTFHVLGAKEGAIKDLLPRIKSAAIAQNFEWPRAKQIIVNLRPAPVQVNSRGLDLAILVGVLAATGQIELPEGRDDWIFYGELTLDGEILAPQDLFLFRETDQLKRLITGKNAESGRVIERIGSWLEGGLPTEKGTALPPLQRPELTPLTVTSKCAEIMALVAAGEHSTLIAGPAGSGKTTVAEFIYQMLADPTPQEWQEMRSWSQLFNRDLQWRPKVMPHHSTPVLSMLGGGFPPYPGELTRAHGGLLILDEYLEFSPRVQEGLREPLEKGEITISRRNQSKAYPARFLLIATTNLCPCGDLTPDRQSVKRCQLSLIRCRSHLERLSGPMLDRFDVLTFSSRWRGTRDTPLELIYEQVERAQDFRKSLGQKVPNGRMPLDALEDTLAPWLKSLGDQRDGASRRRWRAELRVARTLADLEQSDNIQAQHLKKAQEYTLRPFMELRQTFA